tara:strand:+ start:826 stop:1077 length:252 start_codon:yes stop_codon:yes gene_type:complete
MVEEEKEKEKAKNILRKKKWVGIQHVLYNPFYEDQTILDKDVDEWLVRLNQPAPMKYERQNIKIRKGEKPEGAFKNNGATKKG